MREFIKSHLPLLLLMPPTSWTTLDIQGRASLTDAYTPGMPAWPHPRPQDTTPTCRREKLFEIRGTSYIYIEQLICPLNEIPWRFSGCATKVKACSSRLFNSKQRLTGDSNKKELINIIVFSFVCNLPEELTFNMLLNYCTCYYAIERNINYTLDRH